MNTLNHITLLLLLAIVSHAQVSVKNPRVENLKNPLGIDVHPRFSWQLDTDIRNVMQSAYEIRVGDARNDLSKAALWASGRVRSDQSVFVPYDGPALESGKRYYWQVRVWDNNGSASVWSERSSWQMGLLKGSDWKAKWIQPGYAENTVSQPSPYFRKTFIMSRKVSSATAFITSLGLYEAFINGKRVGDACLTPGWTSYDKRLQYQVYDVTNLLAAGNNAVGVVMGNGWYREFPKSRSSGQKDFDGKELALLMQIEVQHSDGTTEIITTDETWKSNTGSISSSEIYHGETIDARKAMPGWNTAAFSDSDWHGVKVRNGTSPNLIATYNEPIRKKETFKPRVLTTPKGERVLDFGQNLVGWVQVKARGNAGDKIVLHHAEVLDKSGNFYTENLRSAKQRNEYILNGEGEEVFAPHFTFQGFRYVKIEGPQGAIRPEDYTAVALYSDMPPTGTFTCSHPLINQLQHNIQWGQRGNFLDVPTDCPQRDERLGWTGDAQAFARTATFNFDVHNFFAKWLKDLAADQVEGCVPSVVPDVRPRAKDRGSAGWADAATIIPWTMYLAYGDKRILADQYESMKAWVGYMERNSTDHLWNKGFHFGDWLFYQPIDDRDGRAAVTDKYLIAQCFFAHSTDLLMRTAKVLGKQADVDRYSDLLEKVKDAYLKEYVTSNGRLVSSTQTAYVLALNFDMLPENLRAQAAQRLVENIRSYGDHLTTGFLGTPYLCHVLSRFGYTDVAYTLLLQEKYPSWLYPVKMGATTIWERWDGIKPDGTFQTPRMNSFNHYAYGAVGDWMYRVVTGIDTEESSPGFKFLVIRPQPGEGLTSASSELVTPYGLVKSAWKKVEQKFTFEIVIPPNTKATVLLPASSPQAITESGKPMSSVGEIVTGGAANGNVALQIGSGKYVFEVEE